MLGPVYAFCMHIRVGLTSRVLLRVDVGAVTVNALS